MDSAFRMACRQVSVRVNDRATYPIYLPQRTHARRQLLTRAEEAPKTHGAGTMRGFVRPIVNVCFWPIAALSGSMTLQQVAMAEIDPKRKCADAMVNV